MPVPGLCDGSAQGGTLSIARTSLACPCLSILRTVQPSCGQSPPVPFPCHPGSKLAPSARAGIASSPVARAAGLVVVASLLATVGNTWVTLGLSHPSPVPSCPTNSCPLAALPQTQAEVCTPGARSGWVAAACVPPSWDVFQAFRRAPRQARTAKWTAARDAACPACAATEAPAPTAPTGASTASARRVASRRPSARCPRAPSHRDPLSCSGACANASTSPLPSRESSPSSAGHQHRPVHLPLLWWLLCTLGLSRDLLMLSRPLRYQLCLTTGLPWHL